MSLTMFSATGISESSVWLQILRNNVPGKVPDWYVYALPDGLWAFSYTTFIAALWNFKSPQCIPIATVIPTVGLVSEILQYFNILPGVFDWCDLFMYVVGGVAGILYILIFHSIILKNNIYGKK